MPFRRTGVADPFEKGSGFGTPAALRQVQAELEGNFGNLLAARPAEATPPTPVGSPPASATTEAPLTSEAITKQLTPDKLGAAAKLLNLSQPAAPARLAAPGLAQARPTAGQGPARLAEEQQRRQSLGALLFAQGGGI